MMGFGTKPELRDGATIRAYLDELALQGAPVQVGRPRSDRPPFATTLVRVGRDTFTTRRTPPLAMDQEVEISFLLDNRRFVATTRVVAAGVFRIPAVLAVGERRERLRATFGRGERVDVCFCERIAVTFLGGRLLSGRLVDLSLQGLRMSLEKVDDLDGPGPALARGDIFTAVRIQGLPHTPPIQCGAIVAHVEPDAETPSAGFMLVGLSEGNRNNIERILARRFPTTFGRTFPAKHARTDLADRPGPPVATLEPVRVPEVVVPPPPPAPLRLRPGCPPLMTIRKAVRRLLVIAGPEGPGRALAQRLREDEFRHVLEARTFLDAQHLASRIPFDILLLELRVGGHYGQRILEALRRRGLLGGTPVILVAERRDPAAEAAARAIGAVHLHERRAGYEELLPVLYRLMA
jgi:hypothetical protein